MLDLIRSGFEGVKSKFGEGSKNFTYVVIANTLVKVLNVLIFFFLASRLSQTDYGILAVLIGLITTITDFSGGSINNGTQRFVTLFHTRNRKKSLNQVIANGFINSLTLGIIIMLLCIVFAPTLSNLLLKISNVKYFYIVSFGIFFSVLVSLYSAVLQGLQKFRSSSRLLIIIPVLRLLIIIILYIFNLLTIVNVISVFVISYIPSIVYGYFSLREHGINYFKYSKKMQRRVLKYSKWMIMWAIVIISQSRLDTFLLPVIASVVELADYDIAIKFISIVLVLFNSYGTILNPNILSSPNINELKHRLRKSFVFCSILCFIVVITAIFVPMILSIVFNEKYHGAYLIMRIMLFSLIFYIWTLPFNAVITYKGKSYVFLIAAVLQLVFNIILSVLLIPRYGTLGAGISYAVVNVVSLLNSLVFGIYYLRKEKIL